MFLQRQFFSRIYAFHLRTLYNCSNKVSNRILREDLTLAVSVQQVKSTSPKPVKNFSSPFSIPLLQTFLCPWVSRSGICGDVHNYSPSVPLGLPTISTLEQKIQELVFPFHLTNVDLVIGDQESHELTVGDDIKDTPTVAFSSILKKRHKKMKKHKYRKRRQLEVFKRRHLQNIKDRKRRAKERKEERRQREEARG